MYHALASLHEGGGFAEGEDGGSVFRSVLIPYGTPSVTFGDSSLREGAKALRALRCNAKLSFCGAEAIQHNKAGTEQRTAYNIRNNFHKKFMFSL